MGRPYRPEIGFFSTLSRLLTHRSQSILEYPEIARVFHGNAQRIARLRDDFLLPVFLTNLALFSVLTHYYTAYFLLCLFSSLSVFFFVNILLCLFQTLFNVITISHACLGIIKNRCV